MLRITLLLCLATGTLAQLTLLGSCPSVTAVNDFNVSRFAGKWYQNERYFSEFEAGTKCVILEYLPNDDTTITILVNRTGPRETPITGLAKFIGNMSEAKMTSTFASLPHFTDIPYWIIGTDYVNWAVVWSCTSDRTHSTRLAWLLSREQYPSRETMEPAYAALKKNGLNKRDFMKTDQKNC